VGHQLSGLRSERLSLCGRDALGFGFGELAGESAPPREQIVTHLPHSE
jgi:hypothetical protein